MTRHPGGWVEAHADANLMAAWLEGALAAPQRSALLRHLANCPSCREWASASALAIAMPPAPGRRAVPVWPMAAAATLLLAAGLVWLRPPDVALPPLAVARITVPPAIHSPVDTSIGSGTSTVGKGAMTEVGGAASNQPAPAMVAAASEPAAAAPATFTPIATGFVDQPRLAVASMENANFSDGGSLSGPRPTTPRTIPNAVAKMAVPLMSDPASHTPSADDWERQASRRRTPLTSASGTALGFASDDSADAGAGMAATVATPLINAAAQAGPQVAAGLGWAVNKSSDILHAVSGNRYDSTRPDASVQPRTLATMGDDVWTGGFGDQLWHSPDAGKHWDRIALPGVAAETTATITAISFSDARHGVITSDDGRRWKTGDGGLHWQKTTTAPH